MTSERTGVSELKDRIQITKLKLYGHMMKMRGERMPRKIFTGKLTGKRLQRKP